MNKSLFRAKQIITKDRVEDISVLPDLISGEVAERVANFVKVKDCNTRISVEQNGELNIIVSIIAE